MPLSATMERKLKPVFENTVCQCANDFFEALYGNSVEEEYEQGKPYSEIYCCEWDNIVEDVVNYLIFIKSNNIDINARDLSLYLMFCEYNHISNEHFVSKYLDKEKLCNVALSILSVFRTF